MKSNRFGSLIALCICGWILGALSPLQAQRAAQRGVNPSGKKAIDFYLIPGTAPEHIVGTIEGPGSDPSMWGPSKHPAIENWEISRGKRGSITSKNTGQAFVDFLQKKFPGYEIRPHVFAKGAESQYWYGRDSAAARGLAGVELAAKIDQHPRDPDHLVAIGGHSHGSTVGTIGGNLSARGVDIALFAAAPGSEQPWRGKFDAVLNFYTPNDSVRRFAGNNNDVENGPVARSPGLIEEVSPNFRNVPVPVVLDEAGKPIFSTTGIAEHSGIISAPTIDRLFEPALEAAWFGEKSNRFPVEEGINPRISDALQEASEAYDGQPGGAVVEGHPSLLPLRGGGGFVDPSADLLSAPVDPDATARQMQRLADERKRQESDEEARKRNKGPVPQSRPEPPEEPADTGGLSAIRVSKREITITLIDGGKYIDGDIVHLILNGQIVQRAHTLKAPPGTKFSLKLQPGKNIIEIFAVNVGEVPPNSAQLIISDVKTGEPEQEYSVGLNESARLRVEAPGE